MLLETKGKDASDFSGYVSERESRPTDEQLDLVATSLDLVPCETSPCDAYTASLSSVSDLSAMNLVAIMMVDCERSDV